MNEITRLKEIIETSNNIVFFGGAGVSTASGIKDFRSENGLYNEKWDYPPEKVLSHSFFMSNTRDFYRFYKSKMDATSAEPNICHKYLVELEKKGKLKAIITQNIDGLHEKAGSKNVIDLHGSIYLNKCMECGKKYDANYVFNSKSVVPLCSCGGVIKPSVILYEEALDNNKLSKAAKYISEASTLIVAGSSLLVFPASSLIRFFKGENLVIINKDPTPYDDLATLIIRDDISEVFSNLWT